MEIGCMMFVGRLMGLDAIEHPAVLSEVGRFDFHDAVDVPAYAGDKAKYGFGVHNVNTGDPNGILIAAA